MKVLILYNARSGHKHVNFSAYLKALADQNVQVETRTIGRVFNLESLLKDASQFDRIVVAGGDGTVSTVAGFLKNSKIDIMVYPGGTANLLARNLGIPSNPVSLADITVKGRVMEADLGEMEYVRYFRRDYFRYRFLKRPIKRPFTKVYFSIMAGFGFAAQMMHQAQFLKSKWGEAAYWLSAFWHIFPRRSSFLLTLDSGQEVRVKGIGILIINFAKIQFNLNIVPDSEPTDGKFEIAVLKSRSLFGLLPIIGAAIRERWGWGRPLHADIFETYQVSQIKISSYYPLRIQSDGEVYKKTKLFQARVLPGAVRFVHNL